MRTITMLALPFLAGCYGSYAADDSHDAAREADGPGDSRPDDTTPDVAPDSTRPPDGAECITDDDCTVALPEDRCCSPEAFAVSRARLEADPCLHELGAPWGEPHTECYRECARCESVQRRYYAARCIAGTCTGVEDFCPPMDAPAPVVYVPAEAFLEDGWRAYQGQYVRIAGHLPLGPSSCACAGGPCVCRDEEVQRTIGCALTLRGSTCGIRWECTGTECDPSCSPERVPMYSIYEGYVVASDAAGPELWVTTRPEECAPPGPNPAGERCHAFDEAPDCTDGLVCYYWGDVVMGCDGECRAPGTMCTGDEDCPDGDVCYYGYCEWCCPG
jgi:hypothetical protein